MTRCPYCEKEVEITEDGKCPNCKNELTDSIKHFFAELKKIEQLPFFKTGTHNGIRFTDADLEQIEQNFWRLKNEVKPPLKLGHISRGQPSLGYVDKVRKIGEILYADIVNIPKKIYELIKNKAYSRPSAELYQDYKTADGKSYGKVLSAIALLGAEIPAIKDLPAISELYNEINEPMIFYFNEEANMNNEELSNQMKKFEEQMETMKAEMSELKTEKEQIEQEKEQLKAEKDALENEKAELETEKAELEKNLSQREKTQKLTEVKMFCEKMKAEGKILPKFEDKMVMLMTTLSNKEVIEFSENGEEKQISQIQLFKDIIQEYPNLVEFGEKSDSNSNEKDSSIEKFRESHRIGLVKEEDSMEIDGLELAQKASKIAKEQGIPYIDALDIAATQ